MSHLCGLLPRSVNPQLYVQSADAQLVTVNNPDKILFVGEALVGNEAVDQLTKFDRALKDFSSAGIGGTQRKRGIDGIILTKFDTIVSPR
jgi:signal recognition particle receptor subunit alpha